MRAAVATAYGGPDVVRVTEVPDPRVRPEDVLVRVRATAVTSGDARIRAARFPRGFGPLVRLALGVRRPRRPILGGSFSGMVEATGEKVVDLSPGDEVCGMTGTKLGCHAELVAVPADRIAGKPPEVTHEDAAALLFGGTTALFFLRDKASVGPSKKVLVNGASGAVGTSAVQLARHLGAEVTAVTSGRNTALVRDLGAVHVIDHTITDVTSLAERFDVVLDAVGNLSVGSGRRLLAPEGVLVLAVASLWDNIRARGDVVAGPAAERAADMELLLRLVADGALTVVIEGTLGLDDIVDAHRRVDTGHKVGNIVVRP